jgi:drug/metabolite transporter (DMT)-like permease
MTDANPDETTRELFAYGLLLTTMFIWASAFAGLEFVLAEIGSHTLTTARLAIAALGLAGAGVAMRIPLPEWRDLPMIGAIGLLGFTFYHSLLNFGLSYADVSAGQGSFVVSTIPIWTAVLAWLYLGERVTVRTWIGLALGLGGVGYMSLDPDALTISTGSFVIVGAAMSAAGNIVLQKRLLDRYRALHLSIYVTIAGALPMLLYLPWAWEGLASLGWGRWAVTIYLGLGPIALGYFLNAVSLSILDANRTSQFLLLIPPIATVIAWWTLGEIPSDQLYVGGPLVLVGVLLGQLDRMQQGEGEE